MTLFRRLLERLGLVRKPMSRTYALDSELDHVLETMAGQQQRSRDEIASDLLSQVLVRRQVDADLWRRWQSLSPREQQVAALTCLDYTNPQIAARLGLAVETVRSHLRSVQTKFNVNSKVALRMLLSDWDFSAWIDKI
jgi:DNA-binding CsgD family transcriptional regulator